jgi:hypothetical protein
MYFTSLKLAIFPVLLCLTFLLDFLQNLVFKLPFMGTHFANCAPIWISHMSHIAKL